MKNNIVFNMNTEITEIPTFQIESFIVGMSNEQNKHK